LQKVVVNEEITKEEYLEIQRFYFYKKSHRLLWIVVLSLFCFFMVGINIYSTKNIQIGTVFITLVPFLSVILTELRIRQLVNTLYKNDIRTWKIEMDQEKINAFLNDGKHPLTLDKTLWKKAYELKTVILIYFTKEQFLTICKKDISREELIAIKGFLYNVMYSNFKARNLD